MLYHKTECRNEEFDTLVRSSHWKYSSRHYTYNSFCLSYYSEPAHEGIRSKFADVYWCFTHRYACISYGTYLLCIMLFVEHVTGTFGNFSEFNAIPDDWVAMKTCSVYCVYIVLHWTIIIDYIALILHRCRLRHYGLRTWCSCHERVAYLLSPFEYYGLYYIRFNLPLLRKLEFVYSFYLCLSYYNSLKIWILYRCSNSIFAVWESL